MKSEALLSRIVAVNISVALHALLLFQFGGSAVSTAPVKHAISQRMITRVNLVAPPEPSSVATPNPVNARAEPIPPKPRPVYRKQPKAITPHPVTKPHHVTNHKHIQEAEKKPENAAQAKTNQVASAPRLVQQAAVDNGLINQLRQQYLAAVMAHIEQHKYYPPTARRRGIQGDIGIRFTLMNNGEIQNIQVDGGTAILLKAAKQAVLKALPMPKPPAKIHCPIHCKFSMRYALK